MRLTIVCAVLPALLAGVVLTPALAQPTPPIPPKIQPLALPPAVEVPPPPTPTPGVPNKPLTMDEAVEIALHKQPTVAEAAAALNAARARTQQSQSALGPSVSVSASYSKVLAGTSVGVAGTSFGFSGYQLGASVRKLLFDFDHTRDAVRQAVALEHSANAALTATQANTVLEVKLAFYTYLQDVALVGVAESNLRNRHEHVALTEARLKSGLGLPSDVVQAQTAYTDAAYSLMQARNNAASARISLAELMGIDPRTPIQPAESTEPPIEPLDLTTLTDLAVRQRPEMTQAEANLRAARFNLSAAQTTDRPTVSGSVSALGVGMSLPPNDRSVTVGVQVAWTPFDAGYRKGAEKQAQAGLEQAQQQLEAERLAVVADVAHAYLDLKTAEQKVTAAKSEVANAKEALRLTQGRYRAGVGVFLDVLDAQAALDTALGNQVNAKSGVDQAQATLWHAVGEAMPEAPE